MEHADTRSLDDRIATLVEVLRATASGEVTDVDPEEAFLAALSAARRDETFDPFALAVEPHEIVAENMSRIYGEAGMSKRELGEAMTAAGFSWTRNTVHDIERRDPTVRRVSWEEAWGLAVIFGVPLVELLIPTETRNVSVEVGDGYVNGRLVVELVVGRGGAIGTGGRNWPPASSARPPYLVDPATRLWKRRRAAGRGDR